MDNKKERLIIVGHGASGKDYLAECLIEKGLKKSITYTTRPMREGEIDGEVYHFITLEKFNEMDSNNEFYEFEEFEIENGYWYYGCTNKDWNTCNLFIKTVGGVDQVKEEHRKDCFVVFLDIPEEIRLERLLERNDLNDSLKRRMEADRKDFENFEDYDLKISDEKFDPDMVFDLMD